MIVWDVVYLADRTGPLLYINMLTDDFTKKQVHKMMLCIIQGLFCLVRYLKCSFDAAFQFKHIVLLQEKRLRISRVTATSTLNIFIMVSIFHSSETIFFYYYYYSIVWIGADFKHSTEFHLLFIIHS